MVSIDNVYRTVLNILNKENRGYVTPEEFNTLAKQAQTEIFEKYFYDQNRFELTNRMSAGDYNDVIKNIEEKITFFDNTYLYSTGDQVDLGSGNSATNAPNYLGFRFPTGFYRLGLVQVLDTDGVPIIADEVSHQQLTYIRRAPLTVPTAKQPVFVRHEGGFRVFPLTITANVEIIYIREPANPVWAGGLMGNQNIPVANGVTDTSGRTRQDFELHPSEEPELVAKILAYSGVIVGATEIVQVGAQAAQQIAQTEQ